MQLLALPEELIVSIFSRNVPSRIKTDVDYRKWRISQAVNKKYLRIATATFWHDFKPTHGIWLWERGSDVVIWDQDWIAPDRCEMLRTLHFEIKSSRPTAHFSDLDLAVNRLLPAMKLYPNLRVVVVTISVVSGDICERLWRYGLAKAMRISQVGSDGKAKVGMKLSINHWRLCTCKLMYYYGHFQTTHREGCPRYGLTRSGQRC